MGVKGLDIRDIRDIGGAEAADCRRAIYSVIRAAATRGPARMDRLLQGAADAREAGRAAWLSCFAAAEAALPNVAAEARAARQAAEDDGVAYGGSAADSVIACAAERNPLYRAALAAWSARDIADGLILDECNAERDRLRARVAA